MLFKHSDVIVITFISGHEEDNYIESLKERSEYLNKYLNI
jgi:hypothetical protein